MGLVKNANPNVMPKNKDNKNENLKYEHLSRKAKSDFHSEIKTEFRCKNLYQN